MTFAAVAWRYKDLLTSARLQQMADNVRDHDHRADGSQGAPFGAWASGDAAETTRGAAGWVSTNVTFPAGRFSTPPASVLLEPALAGGVATIEGWEAASITASGFVARFYRTSATAVLFRWTATDRG